MTRLESMNVSDVPMFQSDVFHAKRNMSGVERGGLTHRKDQNAYRPLNISKQGHAKLERRERERKREGGGGREGGVRDGIRQRVQRILMIRGLMHYNLPEPYLHSLWSCT